MTPPAENPFPEGFDEHRRQQILFIARHTTEEQRFDWVEEGIAMFGPFARQDLSRNPWKQQRIP